MKFERSGRYFIIKGDTWVLITQFCNDSTGRFTYNLRKRNKKIALNWFGFKKYFKRRTYIMNPDYTVIDNRVSRIIWFPFVYIRYSRNLLREEIINKNVITTIKFEKDRR